MKRDYLEPLLREYKRNGFTLDETIEKILNENMNSGFTAFIIGVVAGIIFGWIILNFTL